LYKSSIIVSYPIMAAASWVGIGGGIWGGGGSVLSERTEREKALRTGFSPTTWDYIQNSQKWREIPGVHNLQFSLADDDCSLY
jgi:hypothetical protein